MRDVDAQVVGLLAVFRPPHLLQQLAMRDEPSPMLREHAQQLELDPCEVDRLTAAGHRPVGQVDDELADLDHGASATVADCGGARPAAVRAARRSRTAS